MQSKFEMRALCITVTFLVLSSIFHPASSQDKCLYGSSGLIKLTDSSPPPPSSTALAYFALLQGQVSNLSEMESSQPHIFSAKTPAAIGEKGKVESYLYSPRTDS